MMNPTIMAEGPDLNKRGEQRKWSPMKGLFIIVSVLAFIMLVSGITALIFPDLGFPVLWMAFPIGPQPAPIPG